MVEWSLVSGPPVWEETPPYSFGEGGVKKSVCECVCGGGDLVKMTD